MNYQYLDGIRGIGAFCVMMNHFSNCNYGVFWNFINVHPWAKFIIDGQFWVQVFFILSGFVLPISFLKSGKDASIHGSIFRRYIRLLFPVLVINSLIFLAKETFWHNQLCTVQKKSYKDMLMNSFIGVWFGDDSWNGPCWTIFIELWGSFLVYLIVLTTHSYK